MSYTKVAFTNFSGKLSLLGALLSDSPGFEMQEEFLQYKDLLEYAKKNRFSYHSNPFVLIFDGLLVNERSFIDVLKSMRTIKQYWRSCHIVLVSEFSSGADVFSAIRFGASGLLESNARFVEMVDALERMERGSVPVTMGITRKIFQHFEINDLTALTNREIEVLELLSSGFTFSKIAEQTSVTIETVKTHMRHIYDKLNVTGKMEAIAVAKANKFIF